MTLPCLEFCERCAFTEQIDAACEPAGKNGKHKVTARLRRGKPGAEVTLCLVDPLWVKQRCRTRTVSAAGRAKAAWSNVPAGPWRVQMKECNAFTEVTCR